MMSTKFHVGCGGRKQIYKNKCNLEIGHIKPGKL